MIAIEVEPDRCDVWLRFFGSRGNPSKLLLVQVGFFLLGNIVDSSACAYILSSTSGYVEG
jgi:hypothetical protein